MNILKINGTAISGIYVDAAVSFNKPAKRVQSISVPGRNGNLIIDEGAFDNVLISYPVYEKNSFPMEFDSIVNWLSSLEGYQRIECSNDPTHFRLGRFVVPQTPTAKRLNRDGYYQLSFDCKPQRYLNLGEVPTEIDANPSETYGPADIVSFEAAQEDTISGAEFSIVPQQDLHGYDSPWPANGRGNYLPCPNDEAKTQAGVTVTVKNGVYTVKGTATANTNIAFTLKEQVDMSPSLNNIYFFNNVANEVNVYFRRGDTIVHFWAMNVVNRVATSWTDTGNEVIDTVVIRVTSGMTVDMTISPMFVSKTATAPTEFIPWENVCPISGFTGAEITDRGVNLWDGVTESGYIDINTGEERASSDNSRSLYVACKPSTQYCYVNENVASGVRIVFYDEANGYVGNFANGNNNPQVFTTPSNAHYLRFYWSDLSKVSLNYPSTDTAYHASVGATKDITWQDEAGTIYGGTLQYLGGDAWRLIKAMESVDLGTLTWHKETGTIDGQTASIFYGTCEGAKGKHQTYGTTQICSQYKPFESLSSKWANGSCRFGASSININIADLAYKDSTTDDFKTAMSGVQLVYELATPVTYDLTGEELARIVGQNNIFANCGQSTVVITEPTYFVNPGYFTSKPIIRVYGDGTFRVGDNIITIEEHDEPYIDIDSELQDCYCGDTNMNEYVTFTSGEYPVLVPGSNYVLMGEGITKLVITPNWWEL